MENAYQKVLALLPLPKNHATMKRLAYQAKEADKVIGILQGVEDSLRHGRRALWRGKFSTEGRVIALTSEQDVEWVLEATQGVDISRAIAALKELTTFQAFLTAWLTNLKAAVARRSHQNHVEARLRRKARG